MAGEVSLTQEQHGQLVHDYDDAREHMENARTALSNRIVDVDELKQDIGEAMAVLVRMANYLEDF